MSTLWTVSADPVQPFAVLTGGNSLAVSSSADIGSSSVTWSLCDHRSTFPSTIEHAVGLPSKARPRLSCNRTGTSIRYRSRSAGSD